MKRKFFHYALGAYIEEAFKCIGMSNKYVTDMTKMGHDTFPRIKKGLIAH